MSPTIHTPQTSGVSAPVQAEPAGQASARRVLKSVALVLARHEIRSLRRWFEDFDRDILLPILLGEIALHNIGALQNGVARRASTRAPQLPVSPPLACEEEACSLKPCNAYSIAAATGLPRETVRRKIVRLVELGSNTEAIDAFEEGRLDAAGLTLDESLRLAREGTPHSIVAVLSDSRGGDAVLGRPPHASVADLAGGVVLVEDTAGGQFVLGAALEDAGVPRSAVEVRRVQATRLPVAWANGEAAGVVRRIDDFLAAGEPVQAPLQHFVRGGEVVRRDGRGEVRVDDN